MSDEKFAEFLQREAKGYNAPPPSVPRDAMWQTIAAARAARPQGGATSASARKPRLRYAPWIGMAATLLVGIGIGRFALQREASAPATVATAPAARQPDGQASDLPTASPDAASPHAAASDATVAAPSLDAPQRVAPRAVPAQLAANRSRATTGGASTGGVNGAVDNSPVQIASREHLQRAEALVSVVAAAPMDAMMDSLTAKWAREMLTNTRLLLDSPAGDDPARRRLLEDLETVLVQLVQRSGGAVDERELIDRTLQRTQLLTRLRSGAAGL